MKTIIKGIPVKLHVKTQNGTDGFNRPTYYDEIVTVDNVLIGAPSADEVVNELNLSGKRIAYTLAIPKGDTHSWVNTEVEFFGGKFRTIGFPTEGIEENIPLSWNKKVKVERYG
ncbi:hypothetical protein [uncultured Ruminococcus sp.]|uniref:hypothetical protein n=1 Tax=uncultured Ruminococcus sp. TaxID=165186 RepID=UPI0025FED754|nr:hypothetical protein [uncultured Ruminococcus sp.]